MLGIIMAVAATISIAPIQPAVPHQAPGSSLEGVQQGVLIKEKMIHDWYAYWYAKQHPPAPPQRTGVNWDGIARCETGGNWSMQGPSFSGGVGFYNGTWNGFGGREFAPNAGMATKAQQIIVAERVYDRYGLSGWGCRAYG